VPCILTHLHFYFIIIILQNLYFLGGACSPFLGFGNLSFTVAVPNIMPALLGPVNEIGPADMVENLLTGITFPNELPSPSAPDRKSNSKSRQK
jgi:hypothetical protein